MKLVRRPCPGFTLIEFVIVIIVISIMAAALAPLALSSLRAYDATLGDVVVLDKQRYAIERLAREIREVKYDAGSFTISDPGTLPLTFTRTYFDASGTPTPDTVVSINLTSASCPLASCVTLTYTGYPDLTGATTQVLVDEVSALSFVYLDKNGCIVSASCVGASNPFDPAQDVRSIRITLTLTHNGQPYFQQTQVELKKLSTS